MQPHVRNYFKAFGYDESSVILCEVCGNRGNDLHHVEPRSKFGTKRKDEQDAVNNIVCLCRECHGEAHGPYNRLFKLRLKEIIKKRK